MARAIVRKLRNCAGESISETLVSMLIASFALLMLAGAITTATGIVQTSKKKISNYYERDNLVVDKMNGVSTASEPTKKTITIALTVSTSTGEEEKTQSFSVDCYENSVFEDKVVGTYVLAGGS